jgi:hypothetical protein
MIDTLNIVKHQNFHLNDNCFNVAQIRRQRFGGKVQIVQPLQAVSADDGTLRQLSAVLQHGGGGDIHACTRPHQREQVLA